MTLTLGPPPPDLARELEQVRARARALAAYMRSANAPFPEDFPKADILAITAEMAELPDGTARGCLPSLEYVDMRLADIRSLHFPAIDPAHAPKGDQHPALTRDEGLDRDLSGLMVAIATARRVANRIAAIEPEEKPPEPSVPREAVPGLAETESRGLRVGDELLQARHDFDEFALPASEPADHFRRTLTDAKIVAGLSRVELAQKNIIPAWLRRFGGWLSDYPARLEHAGQALEVGVDIAETVHGGWRRLKKKLTDATYSSLREFAGELQGLGRRLGERRRATAQVEPFAISKVRSKILAGEAPPDLASAVSSYIQQRLAIDTNYTQKYNDLVTGPNSGVVKLISDRAELEKLGLRGGGSYYSFVRRAHDYDFGSDIALKQDQLNVGFAGWDFGYFLTIGSKPIRLVIDTASNIAPSWLEPDKREAWEFL